MRAFTRTLALGTCVLCAAACAACSTDTIVWGADGAEVRAFTNRLIEEVESSGESPKICSDADLRLEPRSAWEGLAAGEPEEYTGKQWADYTGKQWAEYADLSPTWLINVSSSDTEESADVEEVPIYVLYRGSADDLCVVGVSWSERTAS